MLSSESSATTEGATEDQIKPVVHAYNKHMKGEWILLISISRITVFLGKQ